MIQHLFNCARPLLLFCFTLQLAWAQSGDRRQVAGKVIDEGGSPLSGVLVAVRDQVQRTATGTDGTYSINVPSADAILVFSYLGAQTVEERVGSRSVVNVKLLSANSSLEEVVVIGYGTNKRGNLTSAQTTISSADIGRTVNTTIEQAIQGRSAGVYITQNSGQPGGGISVNIRGINSINGTNEPLYVIDGVQIGGEAVNFGEQSSANPLATLNPADIEDIQVLQGPSATAIYGSRATNGVLLITTKRGKAGETKIDYSGQYNIQVGPQRMNVMDLRQYAQMVNEFHELAGGDTPIEFLDPSLLGKGTDWQQELFRNAPMHKHQLSFSGGTDRLTYYLSGEYMDQEGIAAGSGFERYGSRLNIDAKPRKWLSIGANLSFSQTDENLTTSQENIISNALRLTPQIPVKNLDGSWGGGDLNNGANQFAPVNPLAIASLTTNSLTRRQFLGGINMGVKIIEGLEFRTSFNTNFGFTNSAYYVPVYKIGWAENAVASLQSRGNLNTYWNWNQLLEYNKQFGKHHLNVMVTHEAQASDWKNLGGRRTGFLTDDILDLEAGDPLTSLSTGGSGKWAMESYLGRINYNYADRYIVSGTIRTDGSVNFGEQNKWGVFPSISAAWRVSQENFFDVAAISELKLRLETGTTGNQGGSGYIYSPMRPGATPSGTGFLPSRYNNPALQWEETLTYNVGFNLGMFKNRIELEADYYIKHTDNLLMENPLPWYMGTNGQGAVAAPQVNIGALENRGWGITLNTVNIRNTNFTWQSNFNISGFRTKIKEFYSESAQISRTSWWLQDWTQRSIVGMVPWQFLGYIEDGLFQSVEDIANSPVPVDNNGNRMPTNEANIWVGDVKFKDVSGPEGKPDGIIDVHDQTFIGNPYPKFFFGFTNSFSYKGFDLSVLLTGAYGNDVYNYIARVNSNPNNINMSRNLLVEAMDYARPIVGSDGVVRLENPNTNIARISLGPNGNYARHTDRWVEDGSYLRIKNVTVGYSLSPNLLTKTRIFQNARVAFSAQNLATFTKYTGFDPEIGAYIGRDAGEQNQAIGLDFGRYPLTPIYSFSLGLSF